jgi:hypothetical protein
MITVSLGAVLPERFSHGIILNLTNRGNGEAGKLGMGDTKSRDEPKLFELFTEAN